MLSRPQMSGDARSFRWPSSTGARPQGSLAGLPKLTAAVPLDVWGAILLDPPTRAPVSAHLLPAMPDPETQIKWTGHHGATLLRQSLAFDCAFAAFAGIEVRTRGSVLDHRGRGGRLSRLL